MKVTLFGLMVWINSQWAGIAILKPYRSYWINYSYGKTINEKGQWINVWCMPYFGHSDIRLVMKNIKQ